MPAIQTPVTARSVVMNHNNNDKDRQPSAQVGMRFYGASQHKETPVSVEYISYAEMVDQLTNSWFI